MASSLLSFCATLSLFLSLYFGSTFLVPSLMCRHWYLYLCQHTHTLSTLHIYFFFLNLDISSSIYPSHSSPLTTFPSFSLFDIQPLLSWSGQLHLVLSNRLPSFALPVPFFSVVKTSWTLWPSQWWTCGLALSWESQKAGMRMVTTRRTRCTMRAVPSTSRPQTGRQHNSRCSLAGQHRNCLRSASSDSWPDSQSSDQSCDESTDLSAN